MWGTGNMCTYMFTYTHIYIHIHHSYIYREYWAEAI